MENNFVQDLRLDKIVCFLRDKKRKLFRLTTSFVDFFVRCSFFLFLCGIFLPVKVLVVSNFSFSLFFSPYLSHFVYFSDFVYPFLILSLILKGLLSWDELSRDRFSFYWVPIFILLFLFSCTFLIADFDRMNSLIYFIRFVQFVFLFFLMHVFVDKQLDKFLIKNFLVLLFSVSVVGVLQILNSHSVGLYFLGEPFLNLQKLGVAKVDFSEFVYLRPYGFFPHPNILSSYLLLGIFLLTRFENNFWRNVLLLFFVILVFLSWSRVAIACLLLLGCVLISYLGYLKNIYFWVFIFALGFIVFFFFGDLFLLRFDFSADNALGERLLFYEIAKKMIADQDIFWHGVGAGNFTSLMQNFSIVNLMPWQFQPVHNIFLLSFVQSGIFGFLIFMLSVVLMTVRVFFDYLKLSLADEKNRIFGVFLPASSLVFLIIFQGMFDHFFLTLYSGQFLFFSVIYWSFRLPNKKF